MNFECPKLLALARGKACQHCFVEDDTVVAAHSNQSVHGKGKSIKAHDCFIAFLCWRCHSWLDQGSGMCPLAVYSDSREDKNAMWRVAHDRTLLLLFKLGLIVVA